MRYVIAVAFSWIFVYAMHAFVLWQTDPGTWSFDARYSMLALCVIIGGSSIFGVYYYENRGITE